MHVQGPGARRHAAAVGEELLQRLDELRAAAAVVLVELLDREPVAVAGRLVELEVDQVAVGAELLVGDHAAVGDERAADARGVGGLAHPPPGVATRRGRRSLSPTTSPSSAASGSSAVRSRSPPPRPRDLGSGARARTRSWRESKNARG